MHIGSVPAENESDHDFFFSSDSFDERLGRSYVWGARGVDDDDDWVLNADDLDGNGVPSANWDGGAGRMGVDDDIDGLIDEELANNVDNDGDDLIDEDCSNGDANGDHDAGYDPEWHVDEDGPGDWSADRFDNDADGLVDSDDPDWDGDCCPGSLDDDGDGQNDEDAAARSSQEYYCVYQDSIQAQFVDSPDADGHTPLDIEVTQHSYGFDDGWRANMVLYEYTVANRGTVALDSVHIAYFADADILAQGESGDAGSLDDGCFFDESHQMMVQYDDPDDADGAGPGVLGIKFVVPPIRWQDAQFSFRNFERTSGGDPETNAGKFALISSGQIDPPVPELGDWRMLMGFGGLNSGIQLLPGAQISFSVAMIGAADTEELTAIAESLAVGDMASSSVEPPSTVTEFRLLQNYPNPFNSSTAIEFVVPRATRVTLRVYDVTGREAATLADDVVTPGLQRVIFDASKIASGVYFYVLRAGDFSESRKMLLIQ
ncbi:MAG: T9SS type A sorting domain-containing protein [bacterium]|nr:T9SS type A sorting domain-containing protein [bacterium]